MHTWGFRPRMTVPDQPYIHRITYAWRAWTVRQSGSAAHLCYHHVIRFAWGVRARVWYICNIILRARNTHAHEHTHPHELCACALKWCVHARSVHSGHERMRPPCLFMTFDLYVCGLVPGERARTHVYARTLCALCTMMLFNELVISIQICVKQTPNQRPTRTRTHPHWGGPINRLQYWNYSSF